MLPEFSFFSPYDYNYTMKFIESQPLISSGGQRWGWSPGGMMGGVKKSLKLNKINSLQKR
jgi:hypothetical protein